MQASGPYEGGSMRRSLAVILFGMMISGAVYSQQRTDAIVAQHSLRLKDQMKGIQARMMSLDGALEQLEIAVIARDQQGWVTGSASIATASVGLALSGVAAMALSSRSGGAIASMAMGGLSMLSSVTSGGLSYLGVELKDDIDVEQVLRQSSELRNQIKYLDTQSLDLSTQVLVGQFDRSLDDVENSLISYHGKAESIESGKVYASLAQASGALIALVASVKNKDSFLKYGIILMSVGNLSQVLTRLSDDQADALVTEIQRLRGMIQNSLVALD